MIDLEEIKNYVLDATGRDITNYNDEMMKRKELVKLLTDLGFTVSHSTTYRHRVKTYYRYFMFTDNCWQCSDRRLHINQRVVTLDDFLAILGKTPGVLPGKTTLELISEYFKSKASTQPREG